MTAPRVTVPVEPTEAMLDAWHKAVEARIFSQTPHPDYMREAYRAMLSAAPAPGGGAVDALEIVRDPSVEGAKRFVGIATREEATASHHERNLSMTNDELIEQALSHPPLEAPAEAGGLIERLEALDNGTAAEKPWIAVALAEEAAAALRAQPPAREDAQPIAWRMIGRDGSTISLQAEPYHGGFAHMMAADVGCTVQPLYTHPAPDALRVALEEARDAVTFFDQVKAATQDEQIAVGRDHWNRMEAALRRIAALQAEQKGGAA